jgi:ubiquinone/menaquinone biosynthesis C-methylase UbiE
VFDLERYLEERLNPVFRAHYALWVWYWPVWRQLTSRPILRKWDQKRLIKDGQTVLDFGCGTGDFTIHAAKRVGHRGIVYALDYFPRQLDIVKQRSKREGIGNIITLHSNGKTDLPDASVDVIWMCDVIHEIKERREVLKEARRVLKKNGVLAIHDSMKDRLLPFAHGLFIVTGRDGKFYQFAKIAE